MDIIDTFDSQTKILNLYKKCCKDTLDLIKFDKIIKLDCSHNNIESLENLL